LVSIETYFYLFVEANALVACILTSAESERDIGKLYTLHVALLARNNASA